MKNRQPQNRSVARWAAPDRVRVGRPAHSRVLVQTAAAVGVLFLSVLSAILAKEAGHAPTLMALEKPAARMTVRQASTQPVLLATNTPATPEVLPAATELATELATGPATEPGSEPTVEVIADDPYAGDPEIRWFNNRPIRPARTLIMRVTAYSPDAQSCGIYADGKTATLHSIETNGGALVAADPRVLPYGSLLTVPGYDGNRVVPVLDCGGAIKGNRLDVLYPTHRRAQRWGVQDLAVTVWEYADGKPADNPRTLR